MPEPDKAGTCVKVAVRCRPLLPKELSEGCQSCLSCIPGENQVILGRDKAFTFDFAFGPSDPQSEVYEQAVLPLVASLFKGFNATVLAYGQTGSGKTFTMGSCHDIGSTAAAAAAVPSAIDDPASQPSVDSSPVQKQSPPQRGIIPRVIDELFANQAARDEEYEFSTRVSFLEIYNDELTDLLVAPRGGSSSEDLLSVREDIGGIKIVGLTEVPVSNVQETLRLLEKGSQSRTTASTNMNATSSRSHAIFTLHVEKKKRSDLEDCCRAKFHLVDLAGSERAKRTGAEGCRFKEGVNINLGLLALGNVISALGEEGGKRSHVPYRDSKLTRLLQDSLGGNSFTLMIACVSPADSNMEETLNTLRYADRARKIKNKPVVNRDPVTAELFRLRAQVQQLQAALAQGGGAGLLCSGGSSSSVGSGSSSHSGVGGGSSSSTSASNTASVEVRKWQQRYQELEEEHRKVNVDLQNAIDQSTELCEKVILAELARDALKLKLEDLRKDTGMTLSELDESLKDPNMKPELKEKLQRVKDIQARLSKLEDEACFDGLATLEDAVAELPAHPLDGVATTASTAAAALLSSPSSGRGSADEGELMGRDGGGGDGVGGEQQPHYSRSYQLQRVKMSGELQELNSLLTMKQELAKQMTGNGESMRDMQRQLSDLELQVERLQRERDALLDHTLAAGSASSQQRPQLQAAATAIGSCGGAVGPSDDGGSGSAASSAASKLSEQRRQRLKELEAQIAELRKKIVDLSKVAKVKEQMDRQVLKLNSDIAELKQQRVRLMRQMKDDSEATRRWKQDKDREVLQLKARDRKLQCEKARLEQKSRLEQAYYRRKAEEAATANRRLKEVLERQQKASLERRAGPESSHDLSSIGPRVKSYVNDDVEMQVSLRDAERHLQQQISGRRVLSEQLQNLRGAKQTADESAEEQGRRRHQIKSLEEEVLLSNAQITDLQQKIIDAKASKSVPVSDRVQSMVEAKTAIRYLVSLVVGSKLAESVSESRTAELNTSYEESAKQIQRLEADIVEMRQFHAHELTAMQRENDERTRVLLQIGRSTAEAADAQVAAGRGAPGGGASGGDEGDAAAAAQLHELVKTQADEIARLCSTESKLRQENEQLRRDQAAARHKKGAASLLPAIDVPDSPYLKRRDDRASRDDGSSGAATSAATKTTVTVMATLSGDGVAEAGGSRGNARITKVKLGVARKRSAPDDDDDAATPAEDSWDPEDDEDELSSSVDGGEADDQDKSWHQDEDEMLDPETPVRPKRKQKRSLPKTSCKCSTDCSTMRCSCKKKGVSCISTGCKCLSDKCRNHQQDAEFSKENQDPVDAAAATTDKPRSRKGHSSALNSTFLLEDSATANGKDRKRSSSVEAGSDVPCDSSADLTATTGVAKKRKLYTAAKQQSAGASFFEAPRLL